MAALRLAYREPCDVEGLVRFLRIHTVPGVEQHDLPGRRLRQVLRAGLLAPEPAWVQARFLPRSAAVEVRASHPSPALTGLVRRWLDLDADPVLVDAALAGLPGVAGKRLPGALDPFELAVRSVLGQRVTVAVGCTLAGRLVARFGAPMATGWPGCERAFPSPAALAEADPDRIGELGILRVQTRAIQHLARDWDAVLEHADAPDRLVRRLDATPGIGPWTAQYVAMRMLGLADAFPPGDVAVLRAMGLGTDPASRREALRRAEVWRPYRSYAVLRLWDSSPSMIATAPPAP